MEAPHTRPASILHWPANMNLSSLIDIHTPRSPPAHYPSTAVWTREDPSTAAMAGLLRRPSHDAAYISLPQRYADNPRPPPSPPFEENKCSLPSISSLFHSADAGSPTPPEHGESVRASYSASVDLVLLQTAFRLSTASTRVKPSVSVMAPE